MTNIEFVEILKKLANETKTVYALGMWGQPLSEDIIKSKAKQLPKWYTEEKKAELRKHIGKSFGFDCVCMIKSILLGFNFNMNDKNGGAKYNSNNVPDINTEGMIARCNHVSSDFSKITVGSVVWMQGHVGVYIGDKQVVECTPKWTNNVQISNLGNLGNKVGHYRNWSKWGELPWINYVSTSNNSNNQNNSNSLNNSDNLTNSTEYTNYTVKRGDTLSKIAKEYNTTVSQIAIDNNIKNINLIITGQVLKIRVKKEEYRTHTVKHGDTLWSISKKYLGDGSRYPEIMKLNNLKSTVIYSNMVLKIPNK